MGEYFHAQRKPDMVLGHILAGDREKGLVES